jgi:hypothetical protein
MTKVTRSEIRAMLPTNRNSQTSQLSHTSTERRSSSVGAFVTKVIVSAALVFLFWLRQLERKEITS